MILVDIYVPALGREYDFKLDEKRTVAVLLEEISRLIAQKEHCRLVGESKELFLCMQEKIFYPEFRLAKYGVTTGSHLLLV